MADETKPQQESSKNAGKTILKVILGAILVILGIWLVIAWRFDLLIVIKGCLGLFLILAGAITLAIAKD
ncbi:MAG: hypothetical protein AB1755_05320 [Candidatus Omnitrophota bacterium]